MSPLTTRERLICGAALAVFIAAFLPWWNFRALDVDGWSTGPIGGGGVLLLSAAGAYLVARRRGFRIWAPPFGDTRLAAALAVGGLVLVIIRLVTLPTFEGINAGARYGIWLALVAGVVETVAAIDEARKPAA